MEGITPYYPENSTPSASKKESNIKEQLDVDALRREKSLQIVTSVLTDGLISSKDQENREQTSLASTEGHSLPSVHGRLVIPLDKSYAQANVEFQGLDRYKIPVAGGKREEVISPQYRNKIGKYLLENSLYGRGHPIRGKREGTPGRALLPVVAERPPSDNPSEAELKLSDYEERMRQSIVVVIPAEKLTDEDIVKQGTQSFDRDMELASPVRPNKFSEVIIPRHLADELGQEFIDKLEASEDCRG